MWDYSFSFSFSHYYQCVIGVANERDWAEGGEGRSDEAAGDAAIGEPRPRQPHH